MTHKRSEAPPDLPGITDEMRRLFPESHLRARQAQRDVGAELLPPQNLR